MTSADEEKGHAPTVTPLARLFARWRTFISGMAGRLLAVTVAVVLLGEVLVFFPTLAQFHEAWLRDRINLAQTAALALEVSPENEIATSLRIELLENAEVKRVALRREGERELILSEPFTRPPPARLPTYNYMNPNSFMSFAYAMETFFAPPDRMIRVLARPRFEAGEFIEIVLNEAPLRRAMGAYALQTFAFSTLVSVLAGAIVYVTLLIAFVRPVRRLTASIERFRDRPVDASIPFQRSSRADEIGRAERAAADMAERIRNDFRQRERLAALGGAVARIAHDLRNMLATAQLVSERLGASDDPKVRALAPRLERSIGRAAGLAASAARVGRVDEEQPVLRELRVRAATEEAFSDALAGMPDVASAIEADEDLSVIADADQLHRILVNLIRNAAQACGKVASPRVCVHAYRDSGGYVLDVSDNGPGVPVAVRERLFLPFATPDSGGAGLGLTIARELARAQGGDVTLLDTPPGRGATFRITLPAT